MNTYTNALNETDKHYTLHPYTNLSAHQKNGPFVISRGEGIYVWDAEGNKLIEAMSGLWCASLGFSESRLVDAAVRQFNTLPYTHMFTHRSNEPAIHLAEKLVSLAPAGISKAFLVNSGSEAVDTALKIAWFYNNALDRPHKKKFISRKRAYHGVTIAAGSVTCLPYVSDGFDLPAIDVINCEAPHYYRNAKDGESEEDFAARLAMELEQQILAEDPDTIAAFIAEPVMGAGGVLVPPKGYFEKVQAILKKYDILFIADEVICGFGRTGNMFGSDTFSIKPDMMTCAKQLSAAYQPIGAVLISDRINDALVRYSDTFGVFGTGNTYGGHPVAAAVALETLNIYEKDKILDHIAQVSVPFLQRLNDLADHPLVGESRGIGLIGALEIVSDKSSRESFPVEQKTALQIVNTARQYGLILRAVPGDTVALCPPLITTETEIHKIFDKLTISLNQYLATLAN